MSGDRLLCERSQFSMAVPCRYNSSAFSDLQLTLLHSTSVFFQVVCLALTMRFAAWHRMLLDGHRTRVPSPEYIPSA